MVPHRCKCKYQALAKETGSVFLKWTRRKIDVYRHVPCLSFEIISAVKLLFTDVLLLNIFLDIPLDWRDTYSYSFVGDDI